MAQVKLTPQFVGWDALTHTHMSVLRMFFWYALPLSVVPPVMIYYAGVEYGGHLLPVLNGMQLLSIGSVFFLAELVMTFIVAFVIQRLCETAEIKADFGDAYKIAVVVPTPLWLAPLFLYIPSFIVNITAGSAALILCGILVFYSVPAILKTEGKGETLLLCGSILAVGMVAWAVMMYITFLSWGFITSTLPLMG